MERSFVTLKRGCCQHRVQRCSSSNENISSSPHHHRVGEEGNAKYSTFNGTFSITLFFQLTQGERISFRMFRDKVARVTEISLLFHASIWEKYHRIFRRADMDGNYHGHFSNFFLPQRSEKTIFRNGQFKVGKIINIANRKDTLVRKAKYAFRILIRKVFKACTDLGVVVIGSAGVDGAGGCGGC